MNDEMAKGFGVAVIVAVVFAFGVVVGIVSTCSSAGDTLRLTGHADWKQIVAEIRLCR